MSLITLARYSPKGNPHQVLTHVAWNSSKYHGTWETNYEAIFNCYTNFDFLILTVSWGGHSHQLERRPILSKVFAPVRENDITKAKTFQCLGKRTSLKLFLQWDIMNLYHSEEEISQTVLKFEVPKETFILPWFKSVAKYLQFNCYSFSWYLIVWTLHLYAK